jgi:hypothetical protein
MADMTPAVVMSENGWVTEQQQAPVKPVLSAAAAKRANASVRGMILALLCSVLVFIPVVLINPANRAETFDRNIDVAAIAQQAAGTAGYTPLAVGLPEGWTSNYARWNVGSSDGVPNWEVGYLTPGGQFIGLTQTNNANDTWISQRTDQAPVTGARTIAGVDFELRDRPDSDTSLVARIDGSTVLLKGTAELEEFDVLGTAIVEDLRGS